MARADYCRCSDTVLDRRYVIVTSPQDLVSMIVKKAYHMAKDMDIPVLGIVENFSYLKCPDCGRKIEVFGKSRIGEIAKELDIPVLGRIPIAPKLTEAVDGEAFDQVKNVYLDDAAKVLEV